MISKKTKRIGACLSLVAVMMVGVTLAYFSADTGTKVNSFTGGDNITGETTETEWDKDTTIGNDYFPGDAMYKNPTVKLNGDVDGYVGLKVTVIDKTTGTDIEMSLSDFTTKYGTFYSGSNNDYTKPVDEVIDTLTPTMNLGTGASQWTDLNDGIFMYNSVVSAGSSATPLFDAVRINTGIYRYYSVDSTTQTVYKYDLDLDGNKVESTKTEVTSNTFVSSNEVLVDANGNMLSNFDLPTFDIVIKGYAVQSKNITKDDAATEIKKLVNTNE